MILPPTSKPEAAPEQQVLALARPLALLFGAAVVGAGGLGWGRAGTTAAAIGVALSLANVWVLHRLGARATRLAGVDDVVQATQAATGLQAALAAKTVVLLALVAVLANRAATARTMTPFALGLLVTVFALLAAGLAAPLAGRFHRGSSGQISQPIS
jgi:hypothetical protein